MSIFKHELKRNQSSFLTWTLAIGSLLMICIILFPEMKDEMSGVNDIFSSMGSFTSAFGMDKLNFGTFIGYYAIECGNILGLGGAFYASLQAINMLSKEEKDKTAEFLLSHPVTRTRLVTEKLMALIFEITMMNLIIYLWAMIVILIIKEELPLAQMNLLHLSYYFMQIELTGICFGISAWMKRGNMGIGIGIAMTMYLLNLIANLTTSVSFLKYITPFGYCDGANVVSLGHLEGIKIFIGMIFCTLSVLYAYIKYIRKDIY